MLFPNAAGGNARRKFQFLNANTAISRGIKSNASVKLRIKPQPAQGNMLEREKQFRVLLQQQALVLALELYHNLRIFQLSRSGWRGGFDFIRQLEAAFLKKRVEAPPQFRRDCSVI